MEILLWVVLTFLSGSLPFSFWIGKFILHKDIRFYGNGNPGMTNVFRAGGKAWGVVAMLLDGLKGAIPVGLAKWLYGLDGWGLGAIAVAPILGHAFSPFLRLHGGKAVAVSFGIWTGLTLWKAPILLGLCLAFILLITSSEAWPLIPGMLALLIYLLSNGATNWMLAVWGTNALVLLWKHRIEFHKPPHLRPWIKRLSHLPIK